MRVQNPLTYGEKLLSLVLPKERYTEAKLESMYQENKLAKPGGITLDGTPIDLRKITTPTFIVGTKEDHIAPWKSAYRATQLYGGPVEFVLSASGHMYRRGDLLEWLKANSRTTTSERRPNAGRRKAVADA